MGQEADTLVPIINTDKHSAANKLKEREFGIMLLATSMHTNIILL